MKGISQYPYSLKQAHERIEELESQLSRLLVENSALRAINTPKRSSQTTSSTKPATPSGIKNYARATVSSRCKDRSTPQKSNGNDKKPPRTVVIAGERYIYKAGVPTPITTRDTWTNLPRYSVATKASDRRASEIQTERWEKESKRVEPPWPTTTWNVAEQKDFIPAPYPIESSFSDQDTLVGDDPEEDSLAKMSRLDERLDFGSDVVFIDVRTGLDYLREAAEITQFAIFEAGSCMPEWNVSQFAEDPNAVRLGRDEMKVWMGSTFPGSTRCHNGYKCNDIYNALLDIVPMRNTICHPCGYALGDAVRLDKLLYRAQRFSVMVGDENRTLKIRGLRDKLRTVAETSLQEVKSLRHLVLQPYYEMDPKIHHKKMFDRALLDERNNNYWGCEEVLAVAHEWERVEDYSG
ncbi:hypothetical protein F4803DRAFT_557710 [Xylaria telfairii]|nr:hypothetical protein F4803DRAFT_557710 [Xylaria telfairii]